MVTASLGSGHILEAEIWGLLKGLEMTWKYKLLDVELDSNTVVNLIYNPISPMHP